MGWSGWGIQSASRSRRALIIPIYVGRDREAQQGKAGAHVLFDCLIDTLAQVAQARHAGECAAQVAQLVFRQLVRLRLPGTHQAQAGEVRHGGRIQPRQCQQSSGHDKVLKLREVLEHR